jgi:ATP-binding cassette subfamily C protein CydCD
MHSRLLSLTRNSRSALVLTILSGFLSGLLTIGQAYLISKTINGVFLDRQTLEQISTWIRLLFLVITARGISTWVNEVSANAIAVKTKTDLREQLFAHILKLGPAFSRAEKTGELTATAIEGVEALDAYFSQYLPQLVISTIVPVTILILVFPLDPLSGLILLLTAPLIPFFMYMIGRGAEAITKSRYENLSRLAAYFLESLQGMTTLKLFGQAKAQTQNLARVSDQFRDSTLKVLQVTFLSAFALELLAALSTALIAVEVGLRLLYGRMEFHEALFLLILAPEFYLPLRNLGQRFHAGMAGTTAAKRIFEILDEPLDNEESKQSIEPGEPRNINPVPVFSNLIISNLTYTYPGEVKPTLENISLLIQAGQNIALVGSSGAGKTTLVNLLLRFIRPSMGSISFNGEPVSKISIEDWHKLIAWVPQNPHLFHDTIAANIRLGKPTATIEEVAGAARDTHLDLFIESLPQKYETQIGEGGARLSSGQAQRLAIARALLIKAPILILDEPTSCLDPETETYIEELNLHPDAGVTIITIAHRLNTIFNADQIIVIDEGRIIESGTHKELIDQGGSYAKIIQTASRSDVERFDTTLPPLPNNIQAPSVINQPSLKLSRSGSFNHPASTFLRLISFLKGTWGWVGLSILLGSLTIGSSVALMGTSAWLISTAALQPSIAVLEVAIVGVRFFGISRAVFRYLERMVSHNVTFKLLGRIRVWFYEKLEPLAPARLMEYRAGDLLGRIISDVDTLENFYVRVLAPPLIALLVAIGTAIFLALKDPNLAEILIGFFLLIGAISPILSHFMSRQTGKNIIHQRADLQVQLVDGIQGLADILAFGRGIDRLSQIRSDGIKYGESQKNMARISGFFSGLTTYLANIALWSVLLIAIPLVTSSRLDGVLLATLALLTLASFEAVIPLPLTAQMWTSTKEAAERLFEIVDAEPFVHDVPGTDDNAQTHVGSSHQSVKNEINISNLSFDYPGTRSPALDHISVDLRPGHSAAIVGPSGAGKSTLANILLRFWDYDTGEIRLGNRSLNSLLPDEVRENIAYISQNTHFFNTSIYENLRFARQKVTREEIESATCQSQIHDFITSLTKGYETMIGEQGLRLSGGERQRLAIARAIIKNAPILILDEPTANLDPITEKLILQTLFRIMQDKTSLLITHRLIGLENMAEILVMEQGSIAERGTHKELILHKGLYWRLFQLQNRILAEE